MDTAVLTSQIRAALKMLRQSIESCPEDLWSRPTDHNAFWVLAYHTVFFAHLYLSASQESFEHFEREVQGHECFGKSDLGDWSELTSGDEFAKDDVLAYCDHVHEHVSQWVGATPFDAPSGFPWLKFAKSEAHLYNLRHIQHHVGQLNERLRQEAGIGFGWTFDGR